MTSNNNTLTARVTAQGNEIAALQSDVSEIKGMVAALLAAKGVTAPVATEPVSLVKAQVQAPVSLVKAPKVEEAAPTFGKPFTKGNRDEFIKVAPWAKGMGTGAIKDVLVKNPDLMPEGWYLPTGIAKEKRAAAIAKHQAGQMAGMTSDPDAGTWCDCPPEAEVTEVVVAHVEADEPAYMSDEWIAKTHPREKDTPRNAQGRPTPKREWKLRHALAETGTFDRDEVDAQVALILGASV